MYKYKLCRLCMCENESMMDVTEKCGKQGFVVIDTIKDLLQFEVNEKAGIPWMVCPTCLELLSDFRRFKERCVQCKLEFENRHQLTDHSYSMLWGSQNKIKSAGLEKITLVKEESRETSTRRDKLLSATGCSVPDPPVLQVVDQRVDGTTNQRDIKFYCCQKNVKDLNGRHVYRFRCHAAKRRVYSCWHCDKSYKHKCELSRHVLSHFKRRVYQWDIEGDTLGQEMSPTEETHENVIEPDDLNKQLVEAKDEKSAIFKCHLCHKGFWNKHTLYNHRKTKCGSLTYVCDVCRREYRSQNALKQHTKVNHSNASYECNICSKTFNDKYYFRTHLMIHNNVRPHKCTFCDKAFYVSTHLRSHMVTHSLNRPHQCTYCSKSFTRKKALEEHNNIHTGDEPYCCILCSKRFKRKRNLRSHIKTHDSADIIHESHASGM